MHIVSFLISCLLLLGVLGLVCYFVGDSLKPLTAWLGVICALCSLCGFAVFLLSVAVLGVSPGSDKMGVTVATYSTFGSLAFALCLAGLCAFFFWLNSRVKTGGGLRWRGDAGR